MTTTIASQHLQEKWLAISYLRHHCVPLKIIACPQTAALWAKWQAALWTCYIPNPGITLDTIFYPASRSSAHVWHPGTSPKHSKFKTGILKGRAPAPPCVSIWLHRDQLHGEIWLSFTAPIALIQIPPHPALLEALAESETLQTVITGCKPV